MTYERASFLVIKLDGIGDFALALPALRGLANAYPDARLDVVISSFNESWMDVVPWIRNWYPVDFRGYRLEEPRRMGKAALMWRLFALGITLRRNGYEAAFDLRTVIGDWRGKVIAWLSGAPIRVGGLGAGEWALTRVSRESSTHQSDILLERLRIFAPGLEKARSGLVNVSRVRPKTPRPHILLHPGAGNAAKRWPVKNWIELALELRIFRDPVTFQFLGGPEDEARLQEILDGASLDAGQTRVSTSLRETLQALADADLLVGLDSAAPHLAYLVGTPAVTIFSAANDSARWQALGENEVLSTPIECGPCQLSRCKWETHRCMEAITPATVLSTIKQKLDVSGVRLPF